MRKSMAAVLIFILITVSGSSNAMDLAAQEARYLSVHQARDLLEQRIPEKVELWDGCCCAKRRSCCNKCCSVPVVALYVTFGVLGFGALISAAVCTGVAFPDADAGHPHYNPELFVVGMVLWGVFAGTVVGPPALIFLTNCIRKYMAYCDYLHVEDQKNILACIPNDEARLGEEFVFIIGDHLLGDPKLYQVLDAEQVLALASLPSFNELVDKGLFAHDANALAIAYRQLSEMPTVELASVITNMQMTQMFEKYPTLEEKIKVRLPKKTDIDVYTPLLSFEALTEVISNSDSAEKYSLLIDDQIISASKLEWEEISETLKSMFQDITDPSKELSLLIGSPAQKKMLVAFMRMPQKKDLK